MRTIYIIYCLIVSTTITSCNYASSGDGSYRSWGSGSGYRSTGGGGFHK